MKINVYAANLLRRPDRRASLQKQFAGRSEFALHIVPAVEMDNGAWGLWQTFRQIVAEEAAREDSRYFVFCEADHVFTSAYDAKGLVSCIAEAERLGADVLSGGVSWLSNPVQVSADLFHVDAFNGMQFTVVFRSFYSKFLSYETERGFVLDRFISSLTSRIFVISPFVSVQKEFGYSDVTSRNNEPGRVSALFERTERMLGTLCKVKSFYASLPSVECAPMSEDGDDGVYLPTYVVNLPARTDRREHIEREFLGRKEFKVQIVDACVSRHGARGLWESLCKVVRMAKSNDDDVILFCEDDHTFVSHYHPSHFFRQVAEAGAMGAELLLGGIGHFGHLVPVRNGLYWCDSFWCTQFTVIYRKAYDAILSYLFADDDVADDVLSRLFINKLVVFPFISEQTDFGYSDVTPSNNLKGQITAHFQRSWKEAFQIHETVLRYHAAEGMLIDVQAEAFHIYLMTPSSFKGLQLGCGSNILAGWLNTDKSRTQGAEQLDASQRFPVDDETFHYVFAEHLFEHLSYEDGKHMLSECFRVLKKGGILRLSLPLLEFLAKLYEDSLSPSSQRYALWSLQNNAPQQYADFANQGKPVPVSLVVNNFMHLWGHRMLYDRTTLCTMLQKAGFAEVRECAIGQSLCTDLCGLEHHGDVIPAWANAMETTCFEAIKNL